MNDCYGNDPGVWWLLTWFESPEANSFLLPSLSLSLSPPSSIIFSIYRRQSFWSYVQCPGNFLYMYMVFIIRRRRHYLRSYPNVTHDCNNSDLHCTWDPSFGIDTHCPLPDYRLSFRSWYIGYEMRGMGPNYFGYHRLVFRAQLFAISNCTNV